MTSYRCARTAAGARAWLVALCAACATTVHAGARAWLVALCAACALTMPAAAQAGALGTAQTGAPPAAQTGEVAGRITAEGDVPLAHVRVEVRNTGRAAVSAEDGSFRITGVPAGDHVLEASRPGWKTATASVRVTAGASAQVSIRLELQPLPLEEMVVTATREEQRRVETPATIHSVNRDQLERTRPSHPSEVLNTVPGVWVNVTGGEGHMTAIRQPKTTNPVYLYLENGVPSRATGFFNHNALYEVNVPQAERIEVVKGPASALYGSDAIGGMVNVVTRSPFDAPSLELTAEAGAYGYARALAAFSAAGERDGVLAELNVTHTDGWRDGTAYDRQSGTVRWDRRFSPGTTLRSMISFSNIDQGTAGSSTISPDDYRRRPTANYTPISYRDVQALRASAAFDRLAGSTLLSVTPFVRWNTMEMLPNWMLTFDPVIQESGHASAGALFKLRRDAGNLRFIGGLDLDYSPGFRREWRLQTVRTEGVFTDYSRGERVYDYDVTYWSASPYVQFEAALTSQLRVVAGLRHDFSGYDYTTALEPTQEGSHRRPADTRVDYSHLSPKLGATFTVSDALNLYGSYSHGFRTPSESQLFRQGRALSSDLNPVLADNVEFGATGRLGGRVTYELAAYRMSKTDDLVSFTRADGSTETVNAGETLHRGVEAAVAFALPQSLRLTGSFTLAEHTFRDWTPRPGVDYAGHEMDGAPARMGSVSLDWLPRMREGLSAGIEAQHVGSYWMDAENTHRYPGHTIVNLRGEVPVVSRVVLFGRLTNVLDERYAENAQYTAARGEEFAPGLPRTLYIGARFR